MNPLEDFFYSRSKNYIHKWIHYFDIYHRYFNFFRNKEITFMEIGVNRGGSLDMWRDYFGPKARIVGIDIDDSCKIHETEGIRIFIGDQADPDFLKEVSREVDGFDIVLDDGGHSMVQQIVSLETLYPYTRGLYMVEDTHTSYYENFKDEETFMDYAKKKCDALNAWHINPVVIDEFVKTTNSIHFYDSIVMFEKTKFNRVAPTSQMRQNRKMIL